MFRCAGIQTYNYVRLLTAYSTTTLLLATKMTKFARCQQQLLFIMSWNEVLRGLCMDILCLLNYCFTVAFTPSSVFAYQMLLQASKQINQHDEWNKFKLTTTNSSHVIRNISLSVGTVQERTLASNKMAVLSATRSFIQMSFVAPSKLHKISMYFYSTNTDSRKYLQKLPYDW